MTLVFRAVGPAREVIETIRLYIKQHGNPTLGEMMQEMADGHE